MVMAKDVDFDCADCGENTLDAAEYYMVHNHLWAASGASRDVMLCVGCLEARIGRRLNQRDFTSAPINSVAFFEMSPRLHSRLMAEPE